MSTTKTIHFACGAFLALALGCGDDGSGAPPGEDAGARDGSAPSDAGPLPDTGTPGEDAGETGGCEAVSLTGTWAVERYDDVSVAFAGTFAPSVEGTNDRLLVLFERYDPAPPIGTYELGSGDDGNYGTCRRCVAVESTAGGTTFFADRGTLVVERDPYTRRLDASVTNLRLVEVTVSPETRESTPVPDGRCVEIADATVDQVFPDPAWTCDDAAWADGESCHCACGAFDPDCGGCDPFDPECEPNPVVDCTADEVCAFDPLAGSFGGNACIETCDWLGRSGCDSGVCVYDYGNVEADTCIAATERLDTASVGMDCTASGLQKFCAITDGFAMGYCDEINRCRPICESDADCTVAGESCRQFVIGRTLGFCGPPPPSEG